MKVFNGAMLLFLGLLFSSMVECSRIGSTFMENPTEQGDRLLIAHQDLDPSAVPLKPHLYAGDPRRGVLYMCRLEPIVYFSLCMTCETYNGAFPGFPKRCGYQVTLQGGFPLNQTQKIAVIDLTKDADLALSPEAIDEKKRAEIDRIYRLHCSRIQE